MNLGPACIIINFIAMNNARIKNNNRRVYNKHLIQILWPLIYLYKIYFHRSKKENVRHKKTLIKIKDRFGIKILEAYETFSVCNKSLMHFFLCNFL